MTNSRLVAGDVIVKPYGEREIVLLVLPQRSLSAKLNLLRLHVDPPTLFDTYWTNSLPKGYRRVGNVPAWFIEEMAELREET